MEERNNPFDTKLQSENSINHVVDLLKAALPYVDSRREYSMNTAVKAAELLGMMNGQPAAGQVSAASLSSKPSNPEGMLSSIRQIASQKERDMVDTMLNMIKARKLYQAYNTFHQTQQANTVHSQGAGSSGIPSTNIMEAIKNILPPDQSANFEAMSMLMNTMNTMNAMNRAASMFGHTNNSNPAPQNDVNANNTYQYTTAPRPQAVNPVSALQQAITPPTNNGTSSMNLESLLNTLSTFSNNRSTQAASPSTQNVTTFTPPVHPEEDFEQLKAASIPN